ncbi:MAG: glucose-1-phosphate adenylyltransferase subunit GlgD [Selenomonadaceae bacterium]|nr:glucose-1-phosphate adenylyltransferase subunit GlgD [Selenomonadaceae bacterium]
MKTVVGIVNLQESNDLIRELAATRAVEALPFAGRYRVVDFSLSNMINSGISSVGLMLPDYSRAILDHIRSGKDWDLARRRDGLTYLPAALPGTDARKGDLKDIYANLDFAELSDKKYVLFVNGSYVYNIDFQEVLDYHQKSGADITMIYQTVGEDNPGKTVVIETSTNGIVTDLAETNGAKKGQKAVLSAYLMPVPTFAYIVRTSYERGGQDFLIDGIMKHASEQKISAYEHKGYVARINSTEAYYKANRDCLNPEIWAELFMNKERPIFTKVKDEVPVQYKDTAEVKNSLVANGCIIRGRVENSIIFRGVNVGKGAVVKDCILMQRCQIEEGARVENIICDKNVMITKNRWLKGVETFPYIIKKNTRI